MTKHVAINAILAIGVTFVILTGGIDLSVGSIAGLASMVVGGLLFYAASRCPAAGCCSSPSRRGHPPGHPGRLRSSARSTACSSPSSRSPPFIATLGMLYVARGAAQLLSNGGTFPDLAGSPARGNTGLPRHRRRQAGSASRSRSGSWSPSRPWPIVVTTKTPFGRRVFAVGGNERAAVLAGIRVQPDQDRRLRHLRGLRRARRPAADLRARRRLPGHRHDIRAQRHRGGRPRRHRASAAAAAPSSAPSWAPSSSASSATAWSSSGSPPSGSRWSRAPSSSSRSSSSRPSSASSRPDGEGRVNASTSTRGRHARPRRACT